MTAQIWKRMYYFLFPLVSNETRKAPVSGDVSTKHVISPPLTGIWFIQSACNNPLHLSHAYWYPQPMPSGLLTAWKLKKKIKLEVAVCFSLYDEIPRKISYSKVILWFGLFFFSTSSIWKNRKREQCSLFWSLCPALSSALCSTKGKLLPCT